MSAPVIITRPAAAGERLSKRLRAEGFDAAWWPAFDIEAPPDESAVRASLAQLADYDLALFVSPNAVQAVAGRIVGDWPASTVIGAVGATTRAATLLLPGAHAAVTIAPEEADDAGSEGFWRAWCASGRRARRVLLLRAASGRDWIIDQLRAQGAQVDALPVYRRRAHPLGPADLEQLRAWLRAGATSVVLVSSTDAVDVLLEQADAEPAATGWLKRGWALATHPRVAQRLHSAGFQRVATCDADDDSVLRKLESIQG